MIALLWTNRGLIQALVVLGLFVLTLSRGGMPERWCAGILLAAIVLARAQTVITSRFSELWGLSGFVSGDVAYLAIDLLVFLGLAAVGLKANRIYPLWMAGVQLTAVVTHLAERTTDVVASTAYAALNLSTFYLAIVFLACGLIAHIRRKKRIGAYPDWRSG